MLSTATGSLCRLNQRVVSTTSPLSLLPLEMAVGSMLRKNESRARGEFWDVVMYNVIVCTKQAAAAVRGYVDQSIAV